MEIQKTTDQLFDRLRLILKDVSDTNNFVLRSSKHLELIIYTLKIEESKLPKPNGVESILGELKKIIIKINESVNTLVGEERKELRDIMAVLQTTKEPSKPFKRLKEILGDVSRINDFVLSSSIQLEGILYNLQIIEAKLPKPNGVDAITEDLRRIIFGIDQTVNKLIKGERQELRDILAELAIRMDIKE